MDVGQPVIRITRIIEIEHGGHRIHPQAIDVIFLQPEDGTAEQKIAHLVTAIVIDQGTPVGMGATPRVGVFIQGTAVELGQGMAVPWKVGRDPVQ